MGEGARGGSDGETRVVLTDGRRLKGRHRNRVVKR